MYEWLGICLALAGLLALSAIASLGAAAAWRLLQSRAQNWSPSAQAQLLFALRVFPALAAVIFVTGLLLPAYIAYEPRHKTEDVSLKLGALAAISALGLALAVWRGLAAWVGTRRLVRDWLRNSEPIALPQTDVPAYRLRHQFPVIAVVGVFRPRLFIADHLFASLNSGEMAAAISHECGHLAARDNLKRALLRICRDVLTFVPCGRSLDREWTAVSEAAADEYAARAGGEAALDLAAALVKIARLAKPGQRPALPAGALLIGEGAGGMANRVRRLTQLAARENSPAPAYAAIPPSLWVSFSALLAAAVLIASDSNALSTIHNLIEVAVSTLQ